MADTFNRTAWDMLRAVERAYLDANGWFQPEPGVDKWENEDHDRYGVSFGHAVNIQKHFDRICASALYQKPLPTEEPNHTSKVPYLQAIEEKPFAPTGGFYTNLFEDMVAHGLACRGGAGEYSISDKGREVLRQFREKEGT